MMNGGAATSHAVGAGPAAASDLKRNVRFSLLGGLAGSVLIAYLLAVILNVLLVDSLFAPVSEASVDLVRLQQGIDCIYKPAGRTNDGGSGSPNCEKTPATEPELSLKSKVTLFIYDSGTQEFTWVRDGALIHERAGDAALAGAGRRVYSLLEKSSLASSGVRSTRVLAAYVRRERPKKTDDPVDPGPVEGVAAFFVHSACWFCWTDNAILHSQQSFSRLLERVEFNEDQRDTADLRLCHGTRNLPGEKRKCVVVRDLVDTLFGPSAGLLNGRTSLGQVNADYIIRTLVQGVIQFFTVMWAAWMILWIARTHATTARRASLLFDATGQALRGSAFEEGFKEVLSIRDGVFPERLSAMDKLALYWLPSEDDKVGSTAQERLGGGVAQLRQRVEDDLEFAFRGPEHLLKLALLGTMIGIALALFEARNTSTPDIVARALTEAAMFAGIAVALGTTIVGVVAAFVVTIGRGWLFSARIAELDWAYDAQSRITELPEVPVLAQRPTLPLKQRRRGGFAAFVFVSVLVVAGVVGWQFYARASMHQPIAGLTSR